MRLKLPISANAGTLQRNKFLLFLASGQETTLPLPILARGSVCARRVQQYTVKPEGGVSQHVPWYMACTCVSPHGELGGEVR